MTDSQFMGMLIGAIATILGIAGLISTLIVIPVIKLNRNIEKLNNKIEGIEKDDETLNNRVNKHGVQIDEANLKIREHEIQLQHHSEEIAELRRHTI